ncbi:MAG TPA: hypothetical protein VFD91_07775, partial [Mariniphaga sp.]|nr:hypothetical protein [Mariniphaga sp.]
LLLNYRPGGDNFYITALSRGIRNVDFGPYNQNSTQLDLGLRFNYDISDFCISIEHIQRTGSAENLKNDFRTAIIGSYRISDSFHITSSFGKNFSDLNNIIALAGINFGFSEKTIKAF